MENYHHLYSDSHLQVIWIIQFPWISFCPLFHKEPLRISGTGHFYEPNMLFVTQPNTEGNIKY